MAEFQFKQFAIEQDRCAMKVCTDACVLGAYADVRQATKILDIGTGTGLLALMVAQRSQAQIDAVEINPDAFGQAKENVQKSPFAERIRLFCTSIQDFAAENSAQYDVIISNPPFFSNHLHSPFAANNTALHSNALSFDELIAVVSHLLLPDGKFIVLLPVYEAGLLAAKAVQAEMFSETTLALRHSSSKKAFRLIQTFSFGQKKPEEKELIIYDPGHRYSDEFAGLLKDYYLIF